MTKAKRLKKWGDGESWNEPDHLITPQEAYHRREDGRNYGFALGQGCDGWRFIVFDVEVVGVLPEEAQALIDEHALLTWDSVHTGRNRLVKISEEAFRYFDSLKTGHNHLTDRPDDDIEIQTSGHAIGPGCEIAHKFCKSGKSDCPGKGKDTYKLVAAKPLAPVLTEEVARRIIDALGIEEENPSGEVEATGEATDYDETDIALAEEHLRTLQREYGHAFYDLSDRLNGGTGEKDNLRLCDGECIDRSATDFVTVSDLYGVMCVLGNESEERARELAYAYYSNRCENARFGKDGRPRKWLIMNDTYHRGRLNHAVQKFDQGQFRRWLNKDNSDSDGPESWTGDYSETTYDSLSFTLQWLSGGLPVDYETLAPAKLQELALCFYGLDVDRETLEEVAPPLQSPPTVLKVLPPLWGVYHQANIRPRAG